MDFWNSFWGVIICVLVGFGLFALGAAHMNAIGTVAEVEQLRALVTELGQDARTEDILGKVADTNMGIMGARKYNKIPIFQFWIPDKIANLELIEIPK